MLNFVVTAWGHVLASSKKAGLLTVNVLDYAIYDMN